MAGTAGEGYPLGRKGEGFFLSKFTSALKYASKTLYSLMSTTSYPNTHLFKQRDEGGLG